MTFNVYLLKCKKKQFEKYQSRIQIHSCAVTPLIISYHPVVIHEVVQVVFFFHLGSSTHLLVDETRK